MLRDVLQQLSGRGGRQRGGVVCILHAPREGGMIDRIGSAGPRVRLAHGPVRAEWPVTTRPARLLRMPGRTARIITDSPLVARMSLPSHR